MTPPGRAGAHARTVRIREIRTPDRASVVARASADRAAVFVIDLGRIGNSDGPIDGEERGAALDHVRARLCAQVRQGDMVSRVEDGSLVAVVAVADASEAETVGARFERLLHGTIEVGARSVRARPRIGVALFPMHGEDRARVAARAEEAARRAPRGGPPQMWRAPEKRALRPALRVVPAAAAALILAGATFGVGMARVIGGGGDGVLAVRARPAATSASATRAAIDEMLAEIRSQAAAMPPGPARDAYIRDALDRIRALLGGASVAVIEAELARVVAELDAAREETTARDAPEPEPSAAPSTPDRPAAEPSGDVPSLSPVPEPSPALPPVPAPS